MGDTVVVQKIQKKFDKPMDIAVKYYTLLSVLNDLKLTEREIQLLAHTAIKGTISTVPSKEEFIKNYATSKATINNLISSLSKRKLLVKRDKKLRVNPQINLDFTQQDFVFRINLCINQKG